jgi:hypothetical protein
MAASYDYSAALTLGVFAGSFLWWAKASAGCA